VLRELTFLDTMRSVCGGIVLVNVSPHQGLSGVVFSGFCTGRGLWLVISESVLVAAPLLACCNHIWSSCHVWKFGLVLYGFRMLL